LGDVDYPIWIDSNTYTNDYDSSSHATEYMTVLLCIMHVIEGWSHLLWQKILPFFNDSKNLVQTLGKNIQELIDPQKLLTGARIPCHCL